MSLEEEVFKNAQTGYFETDKSYYYSVLVPCKHVGNDKEIIKLMLEDDNIIDNINDPNNIFLKKQELVIDSLRKAISCFLVEGMRKTFKRDERLKFIIKANGMMINNEASKKITDLFNKVGYDFMGFLLEGPEKVGIVVKIPKSRVNTEEGFKNSLSAAIKNITNQLSHIQEDEGKIPLEKRLEELERPFENSEEALQDSEYSSSRPEDLFGEFIGNSNKEEHE